MRHRFDQKLIALLVTLISLQLLASCTQVNPETLKPTATREFLIKPADPRDQIDSTVAFEAGNDGYDTFRIPAIVRTNDNTLLAFAEGRVAGAGDSGNIDLVLKRSTDGGATWGMLQVIGDNGDNVFGNPAPVVDQRTGKIILLTTHNAGTVTEGQILRGQATPEQSRRVFVQESVDDGLTWSEARNITTSTKLPNWRWYATGPVHGIQLERGDAAGRLVIPANHSAAPPEGSSDSGAESKYYGAHVLFSDDGGLTWTIGGIDSQTDGVVNSNESTAVELTDGRLYFNARDQNGSSPENRAFTYSSDAGASFDAPYQAEPNLVTPVVQAALLRFTATDTGDDTNRILFSGPSSPSARRGMSIRTSTDEASTWDDGKVIYEGPSAYSDMVKTASGEVGVLYEAGDNSASERIIFDRFPVEFLDSPPPADIIVKDNSGNRNDAIVRTEVVWGEGRFGRGLRFTGNGYLDVPFSSSLDLSDQPFTISLWFKYGDPSAQQAFLWAYNYGGRKPQLWLRAEPARNRIRTLIGTAGSETALATPAAYNDDAWHLLTFVRDASTLATYIDGVQVAATQAPQGSITAGQVDGIRIGQSLGGGDSYTGVLDEVRVYDRALSSQEITKLSRTNASIKTGLAMHLTFNSRPHTE